MSGATLLDDDDAFGVRAGAFVRRRRIRTGARGLMGIPQHWRRWQRSGGGGGGGSMQLDWMGEPFVVAAAGISNALRLGARP